MNNEEILKEINHRLKKHPGDAPWSCVKCYHGDPCIDREILIAAKERIESKIKDIEKTWSENPDRSGGQFTIEEILDGMRNDW